MKKIIKKEIKNKIIEDRIIRRIKDRIIRDIWKLFETEKEKKERKKLQKKELNERLIKDRIITDIRTLVEQEKEEDYYKPKRVDNFWDNNYIDYGSKGDKNRVLLLKEYLNRIKPYLRDIIINL